MKIHIKNNSVYPERIFAIGRGSYGFDRLEFVFSKEWRSLSKRIIFVSPSGERIAVSLDSSSVQIPRSILATRGKNLIFVVGTRGVDTLVSASIELWVTGEAPEESEASNER